MQNDEKLEQQPINNLNEANSKSNSPEKKKKRKKKKGHKHKKKEQEEEEKLKNDAKKEAKKSVFSNEQFIINGNYNLIKMLGFGAFGEIHLAYDTNSKELRAIKFEIASHKNPQLKHEFSILEQLNKPENNMPVSPEGIPGIPRVYLFDRMENKYNYMIMDFLGPSISDLFQFREKVFSLETVLMIAIQMLNRIEYIHEKGFIHRDIKPENFVIGIKEKTNIIHIIDFGLSKRYKDKNSGQHIPYRENRHLVGTVRYASINAHLGIDQSRRDDIESIGYVLVYFLLTRLPWQSNQDKGKPPANKIMEKKLITPPEILCKKLPSQFSYFFHYCKNLKFEDRPDYTALKTLFAELLFSTIKPNEAFTFDWFDDEKRKKPLISISSLNDEQNKHDKDNTENNKNNFDYKNETPGLQNQLMKDKLNIDEYNSSALMDKYKSPRKTDQLNIERILKENTEKNKQENLLGIIQNKKDSKSSISESDSEDSEIKSSEKEKSSDSNYGILKSEEEEIALKVSNSKESLKINSSKHKNKSSDDDSEDNDNKDKDIKLNVKE